MRTVCIAALLAVCAHAAAAQPTIPRLGVEIRDQDQYQRVGGIYGTANVYVGTTRSWRGTVDGRRVGEITFYRTAGADHIASYVAGQHRKRWAVTGLGVALLGAGIAAVAIDYQNAPTDEQGSVEWTTLGQVGALGAVGGLTLTVVGLTSMGKNVTPASQAIETLEDYNRRTGR